MIIKSQCKVKLKIAFVVNINVTVHSGETLLNTSHLDSMKRHYYS